MLHQKGCDVRDGQSQAKQIDLHGLPGAGDPRSADDGVQRQRRARGKFRVSRSALRPPAGLRRDLGGSLPHARPLREPPDVASAHRDDPLHGGRDPGHRAAHGEGGGGAWHDRDGHFRLPGRDRIASDPRGDFFEVRQPQRCGIRVHHPAEEGAAARRSHQQILRSSALLYGERFCLKRKELVILPSPHASDEMFSYVMATHF